MFQHITGSDLKVRIDRGDKFVLFEVLPEMYYRKGHLPGALNLSLEEIDTQAPRLAPNKDVPVVVYCASATCENSSLAGKRLRELGYRNVIEYAGGKEDWQNLGYALVRDEEATQKKQARKSSCCS